MSKKTYLDKTAADFFAGIGLVELGLNKAGWKVIYSLDYSQEKYEMYKGNFASDKYIVEDINDVNIHSLPNFNLAHASFPCTDTSLAGARKGLNKGESASFWGFVKILKNLKARKPPIILIENVEGFLNSNQGNDLMNAISVLNKIGYTTDIFLIDAVHFVPQSRKRLFIVGILNLEQQDTLEQEFVLNNSAEIRPKKLSEFIRRNPDLRWYLKKLPSLPAPKNNLKDIISDDENWWSRERSEYFFKQMSDKHKSIALKMIENDYYSYGTAFRRMRMNGNIKKSMAELRTDGIAGCLRTPKGGSAKQILFRAGKGSYNVRLLNKAEASILMGATEYNFDPTMTLDKVLFGLGDAVVVPVITWIADYYLNPLIEYYNAQNDSFDKYLNFEKYNARKIGLTEYDSVDI